jgi:hypothetical protein
MGPGDPKQSVLSKYKEKTWRGLEKGKGRYYGSSKQDGIGL